MNETCRDDLVSRSFLIKLIDKGVVPELLLAGKYESAGTMAGFSKVLEMKSVSPCIDAVPVVHGRWMFHDPDQHGNRKPYCSHCHEYHLTSWSDYVVCKVCPNCGAKMDGGAKGV